MFLQKKIIEICYYYYFIMSLTHCSFVTHNLAFDDGFSFIINSHDDAFDFHYYSYSLAFFYNTTFFLNVFFDVYVQYSHLLLLLLSYIQPSFLYLVSTPTIASICGSCLPLLFFHLVQTLFTRMHIAKAAHTY